MRRKTVFLAAVLLVLGLGVIRAQQDSETRVEQYIKTSEQQWAEAGIHRDTATVERILADDFLGVAPDGSFYDKAQELTNAKENTENFLSNHVSSVKIRFFGDTAVAQGTESWEQRSGTPKRGKYVWTDTWVKRSDKWQIVAAEDVLVPER
jgi:ketosteroid isomerase-like protein